MFPPILSLESVATMVHWLGAMLGIQGGITALSISQACSLRPPMLIAKLVWRGKENIASRQLDSNSDPQRLNNIDNHYATLKYNLALQVLGETKDLWYLGLKELNIKKV